MEHIKRRPEAATASGPLKDCLAAKQTVSSDTSRPDKQVLLADLARARAHLKWRTEANAIIADMKDKLAERIRLHQVWMPVDDLQEDVEHFTRLCRCLGRPRP
jgi:hypothetical protein